MPSPEHEEASILRQELESRWISLLGWLCTQRGISQELLVRELDDGGITAIQRFAARTRKSPGGTFTHLQFLNFPDYVTLASKHQADLAALGDPPPGWDRRLRRQNEKLVDYRNDLSHADRFDSVPPRERREARDRFREQIDDLKRWWPNHPYQATEPLRDESEVEIALRLIDQREDSARTLVKLLGFELVEAPENLNAVESTRNLATALGDEIGGVYRVGKKQLSGGSVGVYLAYLPEWPPRSTDRERHRRRIAKALTQFGLSDARFLLILADGSNQPSREIELVFPRLRAGRALATVRAVIDLDRPTRYQRDLIGELAIKGLTSIPDVVRRWNQAFNVERVTKSFYVEFRTLRDQITEALVTENPDHPVLGRWTVADLRQEEPDDETKRFQANLDAFATRLLSRLLFCWFLQEKGWLGEEVIPGSRSFLTDLYPRKPRPGTEYFADILVPLFFDGLGRKANDPAHRAAEERLTAVLQTTKLKGGAVRLPYLDGGLFRDDADPFEAELFGSEGGSRTQAVHLPDALFDPAKDNPDAAAGVRARTVLGLLRGYRFTTQESTPDDQSVDPDPELLGKVFEDLYQEEHRHATGAYYTPREIVRHMCREALDGHLGEHAGLDRDRLDRLRDAAVEGPSADLRLTGAEAQSLADALDTVTVVDPAVGSGAYLVGMLQEIVLLQRGLAAATTSHGPARTSSEVYAWKQRAIEHSLHGVDINPTAVEICRLRLWLSLVIEFHAERQAEIPALPNLEFRVVAGDSLIDRAGSLPLLHSLPLRHVAVPMTLDPALKDLDAAESRYQAAAAHPRGGDRLPALGRDLRAARLRVSRLQVEEALTTARGTLRSLERAAKPSKTKVRAAQQEVEALEGLLAGLADNAPFLKPLLWPLTFPEVFADGGFDIVVANPPYVRQEHLDPFDQQAYAAAFPEVHGGTADLYVPFFARALQVLKPGGRFAFISSNKYMRAAYGERLRAFLPANAQLADVLDFGDLAVFSVAAYPAVVVGRKTAEPDPARELTVADLSVPIRKRLRADGRSPSRTEDVRSELDDLPGLIAEAKAPRFTQGLLRGDGWILENPALIRLFHRLMNEGTPLGEVVGGRMYYGIKTGLNEAFVINQATRDALVAADPRSAEIIKPWLRGRDIKRWKPEWAGLYVIFARRGIDIDTYPAVKEHLSAWRERLEPRKSGDAPSTKRRKPGEYKWFEIQDSVAYWRELEQPKIIWPDISLFPRFVWDDSGFFTDTTLNQAVGLPIEFVTVLNTPVVRFLLSFFATEIRGGYLRWKIQYVQRLPLPKLPAELRAQLQEYATVSSETGSTEDALMDYGFRSYRLSSVEEAHLQRWLQEASETDPDYSCLGDSGVPDE